MNFHHFSIVLLFHCCELIEFEKFLHMFGPEYKPTDGHLKPYGWQKKPEGPAKEYNHVLPAGEFYYNHVKQMVPLVYRNAVSKSLGIKNWNDDYLNRSYGHLDVLVELKAENRDFSTGRMKFRKFLQEYRDKQIYIVSLLPQEMMKDIQAVNTVMCGTFKNYTHEANFWMSDGGTRSVIHYDADENFHCILAGRKDFILIEKKYHHQLYMPTQEFTAGSSYSPVDTDSVDLTMYPKIGEVPWHYTTLYAGDCVYIPSRYIHQVRSYGRTISATTLFTQGTGTPFTDEGCDVFDDDKVYTMGDLDFHWTYNYGDPTIDMGYMNVEEVRRRMLTFAESFGGFNETTFVEFYNEFSFDENMVDGHDIFKTFDKEFLTFEDVSNLKRLDLKIICRGIDPPHGPIVTKGDDLYYLPGEAPDTADMLDDMDDEARKELVRKVGTGDDDEMREELLHKLENNDEKKKKLEL